MSTPRPGLPGVTSRSSLILEVSSRAVFHAAILFAVWLLAAGHNRPGGGFVGGLTIASALILTYATGGSRGFEGALPASPLTLIGIGMLISQAAAIVPLLLGNGVLQSGAVDIDLPVFGTVHVASPLFFDIGVLLIVVGLVAKTLDTLGRVDPIGPDDGPAVPQPAAAAASDPGDPR